MKSSPEENDIEIEELKKRSAELAKNPQNPEAQELKKESKITNRVVGVGKMMAGVTMLAFAPYIAQGGAAVMGLGLAVTALGGAAWVGGFAIQGIGKLAGKGDDHWSQRYGAALQNVGAKTAIVGVGIAGVGAAMIASPVVGAGLALEGAYQTKSGKKPSFGIGPMVDIARNAARGAFRGIDNKYPIDIGKNREQARRNLEKNNLNSQSNSLNNLNEQKQISGVTIEVRPKKEFGKPTERNLANLQRGRNSSINQSNLDTDIQSDRASTTTSSVSSSSVYSSDAQQSNTKKTIISRISKFFSSIGSNISYLVGSKKVHPEANISSNRSSNENLNVFDNGASSRSRSSYFSSRESITNSTESSAAKNTNYNRSKTLSIRSSIDSNGSELGSFNQNYVKKPKKKTTIRL